MVNRVRHGELAHEEASKTVHVNGVHAFGKDRVSNDSQNKQAIHGDVKHWKRPDTRRENGGEFYVRKDARSTNRGQRSVKVNACYRQITPNIIASCGDETPGRRFQKLCGDADEGCSE